MCKSLNKSTRDSLATMLELMANDCCDVSLTLDDLNRSVLVGSKIYRVDVSCKAVASRSDNVANKSG